RNCPLSCLAVEAEASGWEWPGPAGGGPGSGGSDWARAAGRRAAKTAASRREWDFIGSAGQTAGPGIGCGPRPPAARDCGGEGNRMPFGMPPLRPAARFALGFLLPACACAQATVKFPDRTFDIRDYGAKMVAAKYLYDTVPIQQAIDACAAAGGGTVVIPQGNWLTGPLFLKSNVRLELKAGAELASTTEDAVWRRTAANAAWAANSYVATINIADAENVAVSGEGRIDGQGAVWWEKLRAAIRETGRKPGADRPRLLYIARSRNVLIEGVSLYNSPSYHVVFKDCDGVTVDRISIVAPAHSPN